MNVDMFIKQYQTFQDIYLISLSLSLKHNKNINNIFSYILNKKKMDFSIFKESLENLLLKDIKVILKTMNLKTYGNKKILIDKLENNLKKIIFFIEY